MVSVYSVVCSFEHTAVQKVNRRLPQMKACVEAMIAPCLLVVVSYPSSAMSQIPCIDARVLQRDSVMSERLSSPT
jgi:hypothetical protein